MVCVFHGGIVEYVEAVGGRRSHLAFSAPITGPCCSRDISCLTRAFNPFALHAIVCYVCFEVNMRYPLMPMKGTCERCWWHSSGAPAAFCSSQEYSEHVVLEHDEYGPCSPEAQAGGDDARECPRCNRMTVHLWSGVCRVGFCGYRESGS